MDKRVPFFEYEMCGPQIKMCGNQLFDREARTLKAKIFLDYFADNNASVIMLIMKLEEGINDGKLQVEDFC